MEYNNSYSFWKGRVNKDRHTLISKHLDTKHNMDRLSVGGGVSLWPDMEDMRLSLIEILKLGAICFLLFFVVMMVFSKLHGECMMYDNKILSFFMIQCFQLLIFTWVITVPLFEITSDLFVKTNTKSLQYNHVAACHIIRHFLQKKCYKFNS